MPVIFFQKLNFLLLLGLNGKWRAKEKETENYINIWTVFEEKFAKLHLLVTGNFDWWGEGRWQVMAQNPLCLFLSLIIPPCLVAFKYYVPAESY